LEYINALPTPSWNASVPSATIFFKIFKKKFGKKNFSKFSKFSKKNFKEERYSKLEFFSVTSTLFHAGVEETQCVPEKPLSFLGRCAAI